jgi:hypothetical protein
MKTGFWADMGDSLWVVPRLAATLRDHNFFEMIFH